MAGASTPRLVGLQAMVPPVASSRIFLVLGMVCILSAWIWAGARAGAQNGPPGGYSPAGRAPISER